ncbi:MAG TPA: protein kinase [Pyrinomonadaceae bacterium]|nr:protein kinase [Pyrinomonadaceae bacterium]
MADENRTGETIGHYRIVSKLGKGGMGEVYLAEDTNLERRVALKILLAEIANDETRVRRFVQEAKAASALNHPSILTVHEIGSVEGSPFIVTEYIKGETLRDRLSKGSMTLREALDVTMQVAAALSAAHSAGLVHRDIKPENIMLRDDGIAKVLDFGLVKLTENRKNIADSADATRVKTDPGMVMGTASYMSPEQARGKDTDARTDIWSLGVVLYEMLAGDSPFAGETANDSIAVILTKDPRPLSHSVPHELQRFVRRALQKDPEERYQTVKDFLHDLQDLKRELELTEEIERSQIPPMSRSTNVGVTQSNENVTAMHAGSVSTQNSLQRQPSSAEYIVSEIRQHKRGAASVLGILLVALLGIAGYFYWFSSPANAAIKSVAVLPFTNAGGDPEHEYLSDGISEALINGLSQLKDLKVIARSSTFQYKGKEINLDEVAKALGVEAVVTGRVVKRGDQIQISAELVKVSDKSQLWGETFTRRATDAGALEVEISKQIAERLKQKLTSAEAQQITAGLNVNPEAQDLYRRGQYLVLKSGSQKENVQKALDYFNQAIAVDPTYALAYVGVASCYNSMIGNSLLDPKIGRPKAEAALKKALELNDQLPEAYTMLGSFETNRWNWAEAERALKRAIELNPNLSIARSRYGYLLSFLGRHDEAIAQNQKARELDPAALPRLIGLGHSFYLARRHDEAIESLLKTLEVDRELSIAHSSLGYAYLAKGNYEKAIAEFNESIRIDGVNPSDQCYLGAALARAGRRPEALAILRELESSKDYVSPAELAIFYAALNEKEKAFASLERAFADHDLQLQYLRSDAAFDDLRSDPRYADLLRRVGFPQ